MKNNLTYIGEWLRTTIALELFELDSSIVRCCKKIEHISEECPYMEISEIETKIQKLELLLSGLLFMKDRKVAEQLQLSFSKLYYMYKQILNERGINCLHRALKIKKRVAFQAIVSPFSVFSIN